MGSTIGGLVWAVVTGIVFVGIGFGFSILVDDASIGAAGVTFLVAVVGAFLGTVQSRGEAGA